MIELSTDPDLLQKPLGTEGGRDLGVHDLERHGSVVAEVVREVHRGHPAPPQFALDGVVAG